MLADAGGVAEHGDGGGRAVGEPDEKVRPDVDTPVRIGERHVSADGRRGQLDRPEDGVQQVAAAVVEVAAAAEGGVRSLGTAEPAIPVRLVVPVQHGLRGPEAVPQVCPGRFVGVHDGRDGGVRALEELPTDRPINPAPTMPTRTGASVVAIGRR